VARPFFDPEGAVVFIGRRTPNAPDTRNRMVNISRKSARAHVFNGADGFVTKIDVVEPIGIQSSAEVDSIRPSGINV
jgi:hypothetical protein